MKVEFPTQKKKNNNNNSKSLSFFFLNIQKPFNSLKKRCSFILFDGTSLEATSSVERPWWKDESESILSRCQMVSPTKREKPTRSSVKTFKFQFSFSCHHWSHSLLHLKPYHLLLAVKASKSTLSPQLHFLSQFINTCLDDVIIYFNS